MDHQVPEPVPNPSWEAPVPEPPAPLAQRPVRVFPNLRQSVLFLLLFGAIVGIVAEVLTPLREQSRQLWFLLVVLLGEGLGVLGGLRLARWPLRRALGSLGFSAPMLWRLIVIGVGNLLVIASLLFVFARFFEPFEEEFLLKLFTVRGAGEFLMLFANVAIAAPLLEEVLIRGILLRGLTISWGVTGGVIWSALFFALIHMNLLQAAPAFLNGVVWALVLLRTGSLGATLFLHSLNNSLVFLFVQLSLLAPGEWQREAAGGPESPVLFAPLMVASMGLLGLLLVLAGIRALPRDPQRLARFWALTPREDPGEMRARA